MFDRLSWFLAYRYLSSKCSNSFVSFITIISLLGVTIGTAILIIVLSVLNGFKAHLETKLLQDQPHIIIDHKSTVGLDKFYKQIFSTAHKLGVPVRIYPQIRETALLKASDIVSPVTIVSDPNLGGRKYENSNLVVISQAFAARWQLNKGDSLILAAPILKNSIVGPEPRFKRFRIKNIYDKNDADILMPYKTALTFFELPDQYISGLFIYLSKPLYTEELKSYLNDAFKENKPKISSWYDFNNTLFQAIKVERISIIVLLLIIVAVAAFNLISGLYIQVSEKQKDMAILRTYGLKSRRIAKIFVLQGLIIGLMGCITGVFIGVIVSYNLGKIFYWLQSFNLMNTSNLFFNAIAHDNLVISPDFSDISLIVMAALFICILATLLPAYRATKILPTEVLRNE